MNNDDKAQELLDEILAKYGVSHQLYTKTLQEEKTKVHMQRRRNITETLRHIIEHDSSKDDAR